jgi:hypothetical protein
VVQANPEASSDKGEQPQCIVGKITSTVMEISPKMLFIKMIISDSPSEGCIFFCLFLAFTPFLRRKILTVRNFILIVSLIGSNK